MDQYLTLLRQCVEDCGWTLEALSTEMRIDKSYLSKLLHGEKPWRVEHLVALPDDVEAMFEKQRAEGFGLIVVEPATGDDAVRQFVSGLFGVLGGERLPRRARRMVKATIPEEEG